jgi:hypothetical protein
MRFSSMLKNEKPGFGCSLMIHFGHESVGASCAGDFGTKVDCFPTFRQRHGAAAASSTADQGARSNGAEGTQRQLRKVLFE